MLVAVSAGGGFCRRGVIWLRDNNSVSKTFNTAEPVVVVLCLSRRGD